ncbi:MAG: hypothetical protein ACR652_17360 [Methylocystis sp.]|uniref:hypothetical protein n=1 Tax=Methylocystis sp. TaxID=1911079 RepID=UPI003DA480A4
MGQFLPAVRLKVRGADNTDCRRLRNKLISEVPRAERIKGLDTKTSDSINARLLAETVLVDWSGLEDDDGAPLPFSKAKALEILTNPSFVVFKNAVEWAAAVVGEDDFAEIEDASKN